MAVGLAVTSATVVIFGRIISDPIELLGQIRGTVPIILSLVGLILVTPPLPSTTKIILPKKKQIKKDKKIIIEIDTLTMATHQCE